MAAKTIFVLCAQALLLQSVLGQLNYGGSFGASSQSVAESSVAVSNSASGVGVTGAGLANAGAAATAAGWNNAALLGSEATAAGWANAASIGSGAAGLGWNNALANSGVAIGNTGLIGNAVLPAVNTDYLSLASLSTGGLLPVTSYSPIVPSGISVLSENVIEGPVAVIGQLPFLSTVSFEGSVPSEGASTAGCGCGSNGNIGIIRENYAPAPAPAISGLGLGTGLGGARNWF
ncbi:chorion class CB protein M5H4-like [Achroia grisella]|uniref:chorion class CB protein M5H4-like n=1 Tax=Achroia grisella TaxID=688607 RepID=UPI0027D293F3|nr:chorion class CB protein M5H4-like [Achroia grisella]